MKKWEYKHYYLEEGIWSLTVDILDNFGNDGWELVVFGDSKAIFKREVTE